MFKKFFFSTLGGTIGAAVVGIFLAYKGFGVWALVAQNMANQTVDMIILWFTVPWRPKRQFSLERVKILFNYGIKMLGAVLLDNIYRDIRQLAIGKVYSTGELAYYNQGYKFPSFLMINLNTSIDSVLFPIMADKQDDISMVKRITREAIRIEAYVIFPVLVGLCVCASKFVFVILTEKWMPIVPFMQVFCVALCISTLHTPHFNSIKSIGRSDIILKVEIIRKCIGFAILFISLFWGAFAVALGMIAESVVTYVATAGANSPLIGYKLKEQVGDIFPAAGLSAAMGVAVFVFGKLLPFGDIAVLVLQVTFGVCVYIAGSVITNNEAFLRIMELVRSFLDDRHKKGESEAT